MDQHSFVKGFQTVVEQYYQFVVEQFKLNELSRAKLEKELNNVFSIYMQLMTDFGQYEKYKQTVFLKKLDVELLRQELEQRREQLVACQDYEHCFDFFRRMLSSDCFKNYLDAFVTSLVFVQNRE